MSIIAEITLIAVVVSVACSLPGVFLVLRGTTMVSDAITHTVLLGIVLAFFITQDLNSPFLIIGATFMGVFTVWVIEALQRTKLLGDDAAIGIVFPLFFSVAIILITRYTGDIHLDQDTVLMGELAFAPFRRLTFFGVDIGARAFITMVIILLINAGFIALFYKELKVTTFDAAFAAAVGFSPILIYYGLMTLVSLTAAGAYDSVGSILVVGFMVGPGLTAYLLTNELKKMIGGTVLIAVINSIVGVRLAFILDSSIAGMIAVITGIVCFLAFTFSPTKGLIRNLLNRRKRQKKFDEKVKNVY